MNPKLFKSPAEPKGNGMVVLFAVAGLIFLVAGSALLLSGKPPFTAGVPLVLALAFLSGAVCLAGRTA